MTIKDLQTEINKAITKGIEDGDAELVVLREILLTSLQTIGVMLGESEG